MLWIKSSADKLLFPHRLQLSCTGRLTGNIYSPCTGCDILPPLVNFASKVVDNLLLLQIRDVLLRISNIISSRRLLELILRRSNAADVPQRNTPLNAAVMEGPSSNSVVRSLCRRENSF